MINTSGGLTGGDRFEVQATAQEDSHLILTTQAAERAYRSPSGTARVRTDLTVKRKAVFHWLPQEFILFDGAAVERQLTVDISPGAECVLVEPLIFGRRAMGETLTNAKLHDTVTLRHDGAPIYWDKISLSGPISDHLDRPAIAAGMTALASVLYYGPSAEVLLPRIRGLLPETGGVSEPRQGLLCIRILAEDGYLLRRSLVPILETLTNTHLPKSWSL